MSNYLKWLIVPGLIVFGVVKLLDKMKALKKKNTEKNSQIEEKKDEASNALDTNSNNK